MNLLTIFGPTILLLAVLICHSDQKSVLHKDNSSSESVISNSTSSAEIVDKYSPTTTELFPSEETGKQFHGSSEKLTMDTSSEEKSHPKQNESSDKLTKDTSSEEI